MQKLHLNQSLQQKLSPQQIQFIKLLQVPTAELDARIEEELEANPALEDGPLDADEVPEADAEYDEVTDPLEDVRLEDYVADDISGYKMQGDGPADQEERELPIPTIASLLENLRSQVSFLPITDRQREIALQLIGSIDDDGYMSRDIEAVANDLAFSQNLYVEPEEVEKVLKMIQQLDPPGIAARNLQECLEIQLKRKNQNESHNLIALKIVMLAFEEFKKKHYTKIQKKLNITEDQLREATQVILKLNPKPGGSGETARRAQYLTADFTVTETEGKLHVQLNSKNAPELRVSRSYADMIDTFEKSNKKDKNMRQTVTFVKQKLDAAKWFIDAIKQRQDTLMRTMQAIVNHQYDFFLTGDESKLRPMILKDIATAIGMDISTVSRVANSKAVQTDFGLFPLKFFFSEGIATDTGEDVSSKEVKYILKQLVEEENKSKPLSDDRLEKLLRLKGYNIARRTVAKYREQLNIPVARLRKEL
jgi:RNA polymerase sigma-54 factor